MINQYYFKRYQSKSSGLQIRSSGLEIRSATNISRNEQQLQRLKRRLFIQRSFFQVIIIVIDLHYLSASQANGKHWLKI